MMFAHSSKESDDFKKVHLINVADASDDRAPAFPIYFSLHHSESRSCQNYKNALILTEGKPDTIEIPNQSWNEIVDDLDYVVDSYKKGRQLCLLFSGYMAILLSLAVWLGIRYSWGKEIYPLACFVITATLILLFKIYVYFGSVLDEDLAQIISSMDKYGANGILRKYQFSYEVERNGVLARPNRYLKVDRRGEHNRKGPRLSSSTEKELAVGGTLASRRKVDVLLRTSSWKQTPRYISAYPWTIFKPEVLTRLPEEKWKIFAQDIETEVRRLSNSRKMAMAVGIVLIAWSRLCFAEISAIIFHISIVMLLIIPHSLYRIDAGFDRRIVRVLHRVHKYGPDTFQGYKVNYFIEELGMIVWSHSYLHFTDEDESRVP